MEALGFVAGRSLDFVRNVQIRQVGIKSIGERKATQWERISTPGRLAIGLVNLVTFCRVVCKAPHPNGAGTG